MTNLEYDKKDNEKEEEEEEVYGIFTGILLKLYNFICIHSCMYEVAVNISIKTD